MDHVYRKTYTEKGRQAKEWRNGRLVLAWATPCRGGGSEAIDQLRLLIGAEELSQASRFRFVEDQNPFLFAHALTRVMLSALLPRSPPEWEFVAGPFGRSRLRRGQTGYQVSFRPLSVPQVSLPVRSAFGVRSVSM